MRRWPLTLGRIRVAEPVPLLPLSARSSGPDSAAPTGSSMALGGAPTATWSPGTLCSSAGCRARWPPPALAQGLSQHPLTEGSQESRPGRGQGQGCAPSRFAPWLGRAQTEPWLLLGLLISRQTQTGLGAWLRGRAPALHAQGPGLHPQHRKKEKPESKTPALKAPSSHFFG